LTVTVQSALLSPTVAVTFVVPTATALTVPEVETVAIFVSATVHVGVAETLAPLASEAVAVS